jgi:putative FmdB family regulatory protein
MPLYEYQCDNCDTLFEVIQGIQDPHPICPECASEEVTRLISRTSGQVERSAKEMYHEQILPEAKDIARRIRNGDEKAAADIFGEDKMFKKGC